MPMSPRLLRPRASGAFTPRSVTGLAMWLDASDSASITLASSAVSEWRDKVTGAVFAQTTPNNRPTLTTINGRTAVSFDGTNDTLTCSAPFTQYPMSIFFAYRIAALTSFGMFYTATGFELRQAGGATFQIMNTGNLLGFSSGISTAGPQVLSIAYDAAPANSRVHTDGITRTPISGSWIQPGLGGTHSIAARAGTFHYNGQFAEILVYSKTVSESERLAITSYLGKKWGAFPFSPPAYADADVNAYINAVEAADQAHLETGVRDAINTFITGCKADGIWSAIKASCILMGARTLSGALTPLAGTAPTNENFVAGDYSRKTGLKGNATNKRLNTNRLNSADPQNSKSFGVWVTEARTSGQVFMGATAAIVGTSHIVDSGGLLFFRVNSSTASAPNQASTQTGLHAAARSSSSALSYVIGASSGTASDTSATPTSDNFFVFDRATSQSPVDIRASFYWIGEFITLSTIQSRISSLVTAIGAAIP